MKETPPISMYLGSNPSYRTQRVGLMNTLFKTNTLNFTLSPSAPQARGSPPPESSAGLVEPARLCSLHHQSTTTSSQLPHEQSGAGWIRIYNLIQ